VFVVPACSSSQTTGSASSPVTEAQCRESSQRYMSCLQEAQKDYDTQDKVCVDKFIDAELNAATTVTGFIPCFGTAIKSVINSAGCFTWRNDTGPCVLSTLTSAGESIWYYAQASSHCASTVAGTLDLFKQEMKGFFARVSLWGAVV